jgi:hypothetical protein
MSSAKSDTYNLVFWGAEHSILKQLKILQNKIG